MQHGFTLIEISIVLVIIGLIVGGILIGENLIEAGKIRSTISQMEKYNTAVNVFKTKYNCLPGDCVIAANFGFQAAGAYRGQRDGNNILEGVWNNADNSFGSAYQYIGETPLFWRDLSEAGLIEGEFKTATSIDNTCTGKSQDDYFPRSKLGNSYINIWVMGGGWQYIKAYTHYYQLSKLPSPPLSCGTLSAEVGISVNQAYNIDVKIDDGAPKTGNVGAIYLYTSSPIESPSAGSADATSCFNGTTYSMAFEGGGRQNCAISIRTGF
jgi:prepilin-type N-terminal cleavage/methylation domain-containing protein